MNSSAIKTILRWFGSSFLNYFGVEQTFFFSIEALKGKYCLKNKVTFQKKKKKKLKKHSNELCKKKCFVDQRNHF